MEQNQFEGLEDIETKEIKPEDEIEHPKQYEKLLKLEEDRKNYEKASNLINFGCFDQKEVTPNDINFQVLEKSGYDKKFRNLYDLYKNVETGELLFILPLVENNQGDEKEDKSMKPYAFDVLYIETMDDETYEKVLVAGKTNLKTGAKKLVVLSYILAIVNAVLAVFVYFSALIYQTTVSSSTVFAAILTAFMYAGPLLAGVAITVPLCALAHIMYKKDSEGK